MLSTIESHWRTLRDSFTPDEWLMRSLALPRPVEPGSGSGLLVVVVAGCDRRRWREIRAHAPFLDSLMGVQHFRDYLYYPGDAFAPHAGEAELFYGVHGAVPGTRFLDFAGRRAATIADAGAAFALESELQRQGEGLFTNGSTWGAKFHGGATAFECHPSWHPVGALQPDAPPSRGNVRAKLRSIGGPLIDVRRGLPAIFVQFRLQHEASPLRWRAVDGQLERIISSAWHARRRHYETWVVLQPDQHAGLTPPTDLDHALQMVLGSPWRVRRTEAMETFPEPDARRLHELWIADGARLSHLYSVTRLADADKRSIASLAVSANLAKEAFWCNDAGQLESTLQADGSSGLPPRPDRIAHELRSTLHQDLVHLAERPHAGQILLLHQTTSHDDLAASESNLGTVLLPARTRLPPPAGALLRPSSLRTAGLHVLGRALLPARAKLAPSDVPRFRIMTYNVHRCVGMDGRRSPHRIIQVLAEQEPDLVALQETGQDGEALQSDAIASEFGLHHVFVPTVSGGHDPYGHALFSRYPIELMRVGLLPRSNAIRPWKEPRAAVWVKVMVAGRPVHVFSTHLGLVNADRTAQINALLGPDWIGALNREDAVILCGDFNLTPNGANYRRLLSRLHDVQAGVSAGRHPKTFSTWHPIARLDHVFTSPHFRVERLAVPRTHLTRVASDHFPLVADLAWAERVAAQDAGNRSGGPRGAAGGLNL